MWPDFQLFQGTRIIGGLQENGANWVKVCTWTIIWILYLCVNLKTNYSPLHWNICHNPSPSPKSNSKGLGDTLIQIKNLKFPFKIHFLGLWQSQVQLKLDTSIIKLNKIENLLYIWCSFLLFSSFSLFASLQDSCFWVCL